jgi:hypothetical protein
MAQNTEADRQSMDRIDMDTLMERISCDKTVLDKIDGQKLILFIGMNLYDIYVCAFVFL